MEATDVFIRADLHNSVSVGGYKRMCWHATLSFKTVYMATKGKIPTLSQERLTDRDQKHRRKENKFTLD